MVDEYGAFGGMIIGKENVFEGNLPQCHKFHIT
jgi:hypothetical protein